MVGTRGRPRQFDEKDVLSKAMTVFWTQGLTGASLDDLSAAMGMTRPSLYNAFGNKEEIYRRSFEMAVREMQEESGTRLARKNIRSALMGFYEAAMDVYFSMDPPVGCFVFCTAPVEALAHPEVKSDVLAVVSELDNIFEKRFKTAIETGDIQIPADPRQLAKLSQAVLHSIALRARSGEARSSLKRFARDFVDMICI